MAEADLSSRVKPMLAMSPQSITSDTTTDGDAPIDTAGSDSTTFIVNLGALADIAGVISFEESDVVTFGGEETAVVAADIILTDVDDLSFDGADDDLKQIVIGLINKKQFVRPQIASTSTTGANLVSIACILGGLRHMQAVDNTD